MSFWVYIKLIYLNHRMRKNRFKSQLWSRNINIQMNIQFSSVHFSRSVVSDSLWPHESQHARPPCPSPTPGVHSNSCPSSGWCHPAISSSVVPSPPAPNPSKHQSELFAWGGQRTGLSALASVLPKKSQGWSPSEWTGWISLQSKGLSRVFSNATVQKHQFFGTQPSWPSLSSKGWIQTIANQGREGIQKQRRNNQMVV